jgi:hypothetical protein
MAYITTGLTNGGKTDHYRFSYDESLGAPLNPAGPEPARTNNVIAACENDYNMMSGWFDREDVQEMNVFVAADTGGAEWTGDPALSIITLKPNGFVYSNNPVYLRYLLVAEVTEIFMKAQNAGWFEGPNEGSIGEGLSRFLSGQFLAQNGFLGLGIQANYALADLWLNSVRDDFVTTAPNDIGPDAINGCSTLFIYYLFHQLGFTINQIVSAGNPEPSSPLSPWPKTPPSLNLAMVYSNLTGDPGDPFPLFKRLLDYAFPSTTSSAIKGPNLDDPWPIGILSFVVDKSSFGRAEVVDLFAPPKHEAVFPSAFWLLLEGFNRQVLGGITPNISGPMLSVTGISIPAHSSGPQYERPTDQLAPQRISFPFDISFVPSSISLFPLSGNLPIEELLNGSISLLGTTFSASTIFEFLSGADPYFTDINPPQNNQVWLSQDLRVFTVTPSINNTPVPGGPSFTADNFGGAYKYIGSLLDHLNAKYSNPTGVDPFEDASNVIPGQSEAYTAVSSVTPYSTDYGTDPPTMLQNYHFAIARVRLRGPPGAAGEAKNVKVFFRLWSTQTVDTDYQPDTYPSHTDIGSGLPDWPLPASDSRTFPCFATGNKPNLSDPHNPEYGAIGVNNKTIIINSGDSTWTYFGCFLNVYDPSNAVNGAQIQSILTGDHNCLVGEIAYSGAPIINSSGVTKSPENSDKLAQRNLQITYSSNPGVPATHLIPQTFDLRPSPPPILDGKDLLEYPDELMIDWGKTPIGSTANIYWPQVNAPNVVKLASKLYSSHLLSAADTNTIQCRLVGGLTYVPIPALSGQNLAGLLTIDLPSTVVKGEEFNVVIRRITTRRFVKPPPIRTEPRTKGAPSPLPEDSGVEGSRVIRWRYVVGTFQVRIPVKTAETILPSEENKLAIFKWRFKVMAENNRWYPVFKRYISILSARVEGLGGNPNTIPPSLSGAPLKREYQMTFTGKITGLIFDRFGDYEGFLLSADDGTEHKFLSREDEIESLTERSWRHRLRITVYTSGIDSARPLSIVLREPPAWF